MNYAARTQAGFTLLELIMVLLLMAIVLGFIFYGNITPTSSIKAYTKKFHSTLNYARQMALNHNKNILMCKSSNGKHCGGDWADGQIIFIDNNNNQKIDNTDKILKIFPALPKNININWSAFGAKNYVRFKPNGKTHGQNGRFILCEGKKIENLIINQLGRIRLADQNKKSCN